MTQLCLASGAEGRQTSLKPFARLWGWCIYFILINLYVLEYTYSENDICSCDNLLESHSESDDGSLAFVRDITPADNTAFFNLTCPPCHTLTKEILMFPWFPGQLYRTCLNKAEEVFLPLAKNWTTDQDQLKSGRKLKSLQADHLRQLQPRRGTITDEN